MLDVIHGGEGITFSSALGTWVIVVYLYVTPKVHVTRDSRRDSVVFNTCCRTLGSKTVIVLF